MMGKIIIGYQDTPQGLDALALGEITSEEQATLIVVGSSHRGAVGRVLSGSVGQALLTFR